MPFIIIEKNINNKISIKFLFKDKYEFFILKWYNWNNINNFVYLIFKFCIYKIINKIRNELLY